MTILEKTIKLTLATILSILLAQYFSLSYASSAGIIAILSVLDTRKTSLKIAKQRFLSMLLALLIAVFYFYILGFSIIAVTCYLLTYVSLAHYFQLEIGIAPITVLVLHLWWEKSISFTWLTNEVSLFFIGVSVALCMNLYMPSKDKEIQAYYSEVEQLLKAILLKFEGFLLEGDGRNNAVLIKELDAKLDEALALVYLDERNHLFHQTNYHIHYFEMRKAQNHLLEQMAIDINKCHLKTQESRLLAQLFYETAEQLSEHNPAIDLIDEIEEHLEYFREQPLPKTRQEFETRSMLFQLLQDLERFIQLKVAFYHNYHL